MVYWFIDYQSVSFFLSVSIKYIFIHTPTFGDPRLWTTTISTMALSALFLSGQRILRLHNPTIPSMAYTATPAPTAAPAVLAAPAIGAGHLNITTSLSYQTADPQPSGPEL
jgi:hypothetical protein